MTLRDILDDAVMSDGAKREDRAVDAFMHAIIEAIELEISRHDADPTDIPGLSLALLIVKGVWQQ